MKIIVDTQRVFSMLDTLLERWTAEPKRFPYNNDKALIPQNLIPKEMRNNTYTLVCFYFYLCIYMRGGIKSEQAFRSLLKMWDDDPHLFEPSYAQFLQTERVQHQLSQYIGWDSNSAAESWVENSKRIMQYWNGDPRNLLKGLTSYDEAVRRIRNKKTKKEQLSSGEQGMGFRGFQYKMVSMFIYFCDWEGLFRKRFLYPAPADFHNFRLAFAHKGIVFDPQPESIRVNEKITKAWRDVLMKYLRSRRADPVEVADAIWLFSLVLCGDSPLTQLHSAESTSPGMFTDKTLPNTKNDAFFVGHNREALKRTCLSCPLITTCELAIPASPYYQRGNGFGGKFFLQKRPRVEEFLGTCDSDTNTTQDNSKKFQRSQLLFEFGK